MAKRNTPKKAVYCVTLRTNRGDEFKLRVNDSVIFNKGFYWRKIAGSGERLSAAARETVQERSAAELAELAGEGSKFDVTKVLATLGKADVIEISIPFGTEASGWGARTFPWESVVSYATKKARRGRKTSLVRHLDLRARKPGPTKEPDSLLTVCSAPGEIDDIYDLRSECDLATRVLNFADGKSSMLESPNREQLSEVIGERRPSVIHLAGVDPLVLSEYATRLGITEEHKQQDGFVLQGTDVLYDPVNAEDLAALLNPRRNVRADLICFATCFSAARLAPMALARGTRAAVAFPGATDDVTCGLFFPYFYSQWKDSGWNLLKAFVDSVLWLQEQPLANIASGLTLWSSTSITESSPRFETGAAPGVRALSTGDGGPAKAKPSEAVTVDAKPRATLNYSLLHNAFVAQQISGVSPRELSKRLQSPFFHVFMLERNTLDFNTPIDIEVRLNVGEGDCVCRLRKNWPNDSLRMYVHDEVVLPLVASLQRQAYERLNTTIEIDVTGGGENVYRTTQPVTLLPADEWLDFQKSDLLFLDEQQRQERKLMDDGRAWLASFTLPRDPQVLTLVTAAQRYLRTLLDDAGAGFDGYQRVTNDVASAADVVDPQIQSFWAGLLHDLPLAYINPPPTYSRSSQRLRTPSAIFGSQTATCIDLALLFASTLEYVGVSPVIFLIDGHAFPGYWRSDVWCEELYDEIPADIDDKPQSEDDSSFRPQSLPCPWMYEAAMYKTIMRYIDDEKLVPFESTLATNGGAFGEALEIGYDNLDESTFDSMVDIQIARQHNVTPLPILNSR